MRLRLSLGLLFAASCTPRLPPHTPSAEAAGAAALVGWRLAGLPAPSSRCRFERFGVRRPDEQGYRAACALPSAGYAGCLAWESAPFGPQRAPVVVVAPWWLAKYGEPHVPALIVHELMHALVHCSMPAAIYTKANRDHEDPRIWEAAGGAASAQARATALIAKPPAATVAASPDARSAHVDLPVQ